MEPQDQDYGSRDFSRAIPKASSGRSERIGRELESQARRLAALTANVVTSGPPIGRAPSRGDVAHRVSLALNESSPIE